MPLFAVFHGRRPPVTTIYPLALRDWCWAMMVSGLYLGYFLLLQPLVAYNNGQGWDGADYFRLAQGDYQTPVYPLVLRIGLPWLAGQWPTGDILFNFQLINAVLAWLHGVVTWLLLALLLRPDQAGLRLLGWLLVCAIQVAPIPGAVWYPVQNDIAAALFTQVLLLALLAGHCHGWALLLLFFFGTLCRENFAQYAVFFLLRADLAWDLARSLPANVARLLAANWREMLRLAIPAAAGYGLALALVSAVVSKSVTLEERFIQYLDFIRWRHLTDFTEGLIGVLSSVWLFRLAARLAGIDSAAALLPVAATHIIIVVFFIIAIGGGTNLERYLYWMLPFLVLQSLGMIEALWQQRRYGLLLFCLLYAVYMQRSFMPIHELAIDGCTPWDILVGTSAFMGHFGQVCESNGLVVVLFFCFAVLPALAVVAFWRPRPGPAA